jgi:large subunit ribosomal protein L21
MYALVEINGKQYRAEQGGTLKVDRINAAEGDALDFDKVILLRTDKDVQAGTPFVDGAKVKTVVEGQMRDRKLTVFKYKRRKNYKRTRGHRQAYSILRVKEVSAG